MYKGTILLNSPLLKFSFYVSISIYDLFSIMVFPIIGKAKLKVSLSALVRKITISQHLLTSVYPPFSYHLSSF